MCAANAVVKRDESGNRKLDKKKSRGRIDGMVALAMAGSLAEADLHAAKVYPVDVSKILEDVH
jgi:phage terminase large subunit-like protein